MPWIQVGGYRFDLDRVELAYEQPATAHPDGCRSVMVTLISGAVVNLSGDDAAEFLVAFDAYRAAREIRRGPPGPADGPTFTPADAVFPDPPAPTCEADEAAEHPAHDGEGHDPGATTPQLSIRGALSE